jgi:hypothetical protein
LVKQEWHGVKLYPKVDILKLKGSCVAGLGYEILYAKLLLVVADAVNLGAGSFTLLPANNLGAYFKVLVCPAAVWARHHYALANVVILLAAETKAAFGNVLTFRNLNIPGKIPNQNGKLKGNTPVPAKVNSATSSRSPGLSHHSRLLRRRVHGNLFFRMTPGSRLPAIFARLGQQAGRTENFKFHQ